MVTIFFHLNNATGREKKYLSGLQNKLFPWFLKKKKIIIVKLEIVSVAARLSLWLNHNNLVLYFFFQSWPISQESYSACLNNRGLFPLVQI